MSPSAERKEQHMHSMRANEKPVATLEARIEKGEKKLKLK